MMPSTLDVGRVIHDALDWLDIKLVEAADESIVHFYSGNFNACISRGGGALELLCKQILGKLGVPVPRNASLGSFYTRHDNAPKDTMGPLQKAFSMCSAISEEEAKAFIDRLRQATHTRNKGSHSELNPLFRQTEGDALQLLNTLALLVEWSGKNIFVMEASLAKVWKLRVFLSVGTPHRLDQIQFLEKLKRLFADMDVELINLNSPTYSEKPFDQIRELMNTCQAAIVVGWERYHAYTLFERQHSKNERLHQGLLMPTAWNHIEGSMAAVLGLPVIILRENKLIAEGVFEANNHNHRIIDFDLKTEAFGISPALSDALDVWLSKRINKIKPPKKTKKSKKIM